MSEIELSLSVDQAEALHGALERLLHNGEDNPGLEHTYRHLGWRLVAARGGTGLTAQMARIARESGSLEEFEKRRDEELGPIVRGLERGENRDP